MASNTGRMTLKRAQGLIDRITLTGPWFGRWRFVLRNFDGTTFAGKEFYLQVRALERCNDTGKEAEWGGRKFHISSHATDSEVVLTAWKAIFTAVEHEVRENFRVDGVVVFDPHTNVMNLKAAKQLGWIGQDVREDPSEIFQLTAV